MIYIDSEQAKRREEIEQLAKQVRPNISKVQIGVWYRPPNALPSQGKTFSIEYECDFSRNGVACVDLLYERSLIRINVGNDNGSTQIKLTPILR
jgi:RNA-dependent RNA polymerase